MMENWASIGPRGPSRYDNSRFSLTKSFGRLQADIPETRRGFNTLYVFLNVCRDCLNAKALDGTSHGKTIKASRLARERAEKKA